MKTIDNLNLTESDSTTAELKNDPELSEFSERLKAYIQALSEDKETQENVLKVAVSQYSIEAIKSINKNCNKCYGRGYEGWNSIHMHFIVCKCIKKNLTKKTNEKS
jgi:hypothetical protein